MFKNGTGVVRPFRVSRRLGPTGGRGVRRRGVRRSQQVSAWLMDDGAGVVWSVRAGGLHDFGGFRGSVAEIVPQAFKHVAFTRL